MSRFSAISIVAAFQAKFIFNVYSDFALIRFFLKFGASLIRGEGG